MTRTGCKRESIESLIKSGAFDSIKSDRRSLIWETGLRYRSHSKQLVLDFPVKQDMVSLPKLTNWEMMLSEYNALNLYPKGHFMEMIRPLLDPDILSGKQVKKEKDGQPVKVAGIVARPLQHPLSSAYFITLEDEFGFIPLIIWPKVYEQYKSKLHEPIILIDGVISRREGLFNVVVKKAWALDKYFDDYDMSKRSLKLPRPTFR